MFFGTAKFVRYSQGDRLFSIQDRAYLTKVYRAFAYNAEIAFSPSYNPSKREFFFAGKESNLIWAFIRRSSYYNSRYSRASNAEQNREEEQQLLLSDYEMSYLVNPLETRYKGRFYISTNEILEYSSTKIINPLFVNLICKELEFTINYRKPLSPITKYICSELPFLNSHTLAPLIVSNLLYALVAYYMFPKYKKLGAPEARLFSQEISRISQSTISKKFQPKSLNQYLDLAKEIERHGPIYFFRVSAHTKQNKTRRTKLKK
jgi:hypothetical protein